MRSHSSKRLASGMGGWGNVASFLSKGGQCQRQLIVDPSVTMQGSYQVQEARGKGTGDNKKAVASVSSLPCMSTLLRGL